MRKNYFGLTETDCQCGCGAQIKEETLDLANRVREEWTAHVILKGMPGEKGMLLCVSGARCEQHSENLRKRGIPAAVKSAHLEGLAVDLKPADESLLKEFQIFCEKKIIFWRCRMEDPRYTRSWVHLDLRGVGFFIPS